MKTPRSPLFFLLIFRVTFALRNIITQKSNMIPIQKGAELSHRGMHHARHLGLA